MVTSSNRCYFIPVKSEFEQTVKLPRPLVFAFFTNPANLRLLHYGWSKLRMIEHNHSVRSGDQTWVEMNVIGILPMVFGFLHNGYEPGSRFGETLIHGPFERFSHVHEFEDHATGALVRDRLDIRLPWYYGGKLALKFFVVYQPAPPLLFRGVMLVMAVLVLPSGAMDLSAAVRLGGKGKRAG
jgi:ligand-binding SRPBCC domain-containing protein